VAEDVLIRINAKDNASTVIGNVNAALGKLGGGAARATGASNKYTASLGRMRKGGRLAVSSIFSLKGAVVGLASALSIQKIIAYGDSWTQTANRLKLVQKETENLNTTTEKLFRLAQDSRSEFNATAGLYGRLARVSGRLNMTQKDLMTVTETVGKAFTISGAGAQEMQAAVIQLGQGLASARLSGDELRSVLEQAPRLAQAIAEGMGVHVGELRKLGSTGKLTGEAVIKSILSQSGKIKAEFATTTGTVSQGMVKINNAIQRFVGHLDMQLKFTEKIRARLQVITDFITIEVTAAIAVIPQSLALLGGAFDLVKEVATQVFNKIFTDPIGLIGNVMRFLLKATGAAFRSTVKIAGIYIKAIWGGDGLILSQAKFLFKILESDWLTIFEYMGYAVKRLLLHPIDVAFKELLLGLGEGIGVFNEDWGNSVKKWANEAMKSTLKLGEELKAPDLTPQGKAALDEYIESFSRLGDGVEEHVGELGALLGEFGTLYGDEILGLTDEQKAAFAKLGDAGKAIMEKYRVEVEKAREANKKLKEEVEDTAGMEASLGRLEQLWKSIGEWMGKLGADALIGAKAGLKEYEKTLLDVKQFTAKVVQDTLTDLQGGFAKGFDALIFGRQDTEATKDALKFLTDPLGTGQSLSEVVGKVGSDLAGGQQAGPDSNVGVVLAALREEIGEFADDDALTKKLRDRFKEIERSLTGLVDSGGETAPAIALDVDALFKQLESQAGVLGRLKAFGASMKDALTGSLRTGLTDGLANALMGGLIGFGEKASSVIGDWLTSPSAASVFESMEGVVPSDKWKFGEDFSGLDASLLVPDTRLDNIKQKLSALVASPWDFTVNTLGDAWGKITELGQVLSRTTSKAISVTASVAGDAWSKITELGQVLSRTTGKVISITANAAGDAWTKITELEQVLSRTTGKVLRITANKAGNAWGAVREFASKTITITANQAGRAWGATQEFVNKTIKVTANLVGPAVGAMQRWVDKGIDITADMGGDALEGMAKFTDKAIDITTNIIKSAASPQKIWDFIKTGAATLEKGLEFTTSILKSATPDALWNMVKDGVEMIEKGLKFTSSVLQGATPDHLWNVISSVGEGIERAFDFVSALKKGDLANDVWGVLTGAMDKISTVLEVVASFSADSLSSIGDSIKDILGLGSQSGRDIKSAFSGTLAAAFMGANIGAMFGPGGQIGGAIGGALGQTLGNLVGGAFGPLGALMGTVIGATAGKLFREPDARRAQEKADFLTQQATAIQVGGGVIGVTGREDLFGEIGVGSSEFRQMFQVALGFTKDVAEKFLSPMADMMPKFKNIAIALEKGVGVDFLKQFSIGQEAWWEAYSAVAEELTDLPLDFSPSEIRDMFENMSGAEVLSDLYKALSLGLVDLPHNTDIEKVLAAFSPYADAGSTRVDYGNGGGNSNSDAAATPVTPPASKQKTANDAIGYALMSGKLSKRAFAGIDRNAISASLMSRGMMGLERGFFDIAAGGDPDLHPFMALNDSIPGMANTKWEITARNGAVVPGPPSRAVLARVHGGERILSNEERNQQGGVSISNTFVINGNGDDELMRLIEASMPRIQSQIETTLTKRSRFGQFSIDSRAIRTVLAD
jgi:tape measure domain-containing protein